jgi:hypothetical protein
MLSLLAAAFAAVAPAPPAFDRPMPASRSVSRDDAAPTAPVPPRGLDTRPAAPEVEMALLDVKQGPVLRIGALGGRHGAAPKLAHVAVGWRFQAAA